MLNTIIFKCKIILYNFHTAQKLMYASRPEKTSKFLVRFHESTIQLAKARATVTRLQAGQLRNWGSIPNKGKTLLFLYPVQQRSPFQSIPTQGLFPL
jgi:hypothetical protein